MTINKLYKELAALIAKGHGRRKVCVAKETFTHNCESDGVTILDLEGLGIRAINISDDDGGTAVNRDGTERYMTVLVLAGCSGADSKGNLVDGICGGI